MIERNRVDAVEERQIVLVGRVVAVPCHDIERRVIDDGRPQPAQKFRGDVELAFAIFKRRYGRLEVARIGQAICADRAQFRQPERQAIVLADVSARLLLRKNHAEFDPARNHADLARRDLQNAELGMKAKRAQLRNDQHLAVGGVEEAVLHRRVCGIEMNRHARLHRRIAVAAQRDDAVDEISLLFGNGQRIPAQLIGRRGNLEKWPAANQSCRESLRRADASPMAGCDKSRCGDSSRAAR